MHIYLEYLPGGSLKELIQETVAERDGALIHINLQRRFHKPLLKSSRRQFLDTKFTNKIRLSYWLFSRFLRQILEALAFLESIKVVHRDVKPGNILRDGYGNIKLSDFGTACQVVDRLLYSHEMKCWNGSINLLKNSWLSKKRNFFQDFLHFAS